MSESIQITDAAARRICALVEAKEGAFLRIFVEAGGCSGFKYIFGMDHETTADDVHFEESGATVVVDSISLSLMVESVLDFEEDLSGSKFVVKNPNAATKCGCGNSFSL